MESDWLNKPVGIPEIPKFDHVNELNLASPHQNGQADGDKPNFLRSNFHISDKFIATSTASSVEEWMITS